jgi:ankyrin repeat protein
VPDPARRLQPSGASEDHPIHAAAERGDLKAVQRYLVGNPALVRDVNRAGGHPLHRAVVGGTQSVVALLLDRGADIHAIHGAGMGSAAGYAPQDLQPIDLAIWGGPRQIRPSRWRSFAGMVKYWLIRQSRNGRQVRPCHPGIARLLIARGAAYDTTIAAALGDLVAVRSMLNTDPSRVRTARPNDRLPLSAAAEFGHLEIVRLLLERGANPTWPDVHDSSRGAALHAAARAGNLEMVELLLKHGADPNGFVNAGGNAVFAARTKEIRKILMDHGGYLDPYDLVWMGENDEVIRIISEKPETALAGCGGVFTAVVTRGNRKLMHRLLDMGIRVHPQAGGCHSYLLEQPDMLRVLLQRGGLDPNYPTSDGITLLHELCNRDIRGRTMDHRTECATILLDAGADVSPKDNRGATPLDWAIRNKLSDMVEFLRAKL